MNTKWLSETNMTEVDLVGGKNASLGEMISNLSELGVNIPNGFVVTANAYDLFMDHNKLNEYMLQKHLIYYDRILGNRWFDIRNYNDILKSSISAEQKTIIELKLHHDIRRYNDAKHELQNYIKKAKYIKTKGLANETTKSIT